ncbi:MAG TPA: hypothetical protein VG204_05280 [Terriglobia bacterium]|nr:hypothetical protein [Terriglobia bacterium]
MNRSQLLVIGTILIFALSTVAQQHTAGAGSPAKGVAGAEHNGLPSVEEQLKVLTEKLDLTPAQQAKIKPIMQELHDFTEKLMQNKNMSREERLRNVRPRRYAADKSIRQVLNEDQKKRLDQYLQGPHPEMHGDLTGATRKPTQ